MSGARSGTRTATFDVIVLGAGAAGLMTALTAGQRGCRVLVIDHNEQAGRKILISGGGRCNFTNRDVVPERFISANRHFARSALARFTPTDFLAMVARHRIAWHEKTLGQLFCDHSASGILTMLLDECAAGQVEFRLGETITDVTRGDGFQITTSRGRFNAPALVLATGGLSIPKMGATAFSLDLARRFGLPIIAPRPGLVPFRMEGADSEWVTALAGVSLPVRVRYGKTAFDEAMLFTHRGLSGPAILQISSYWHPGEPIAIDLLPGQDALALLQASRKNRPKAHAPAILGEWMPRRMADHLAARLMTEKSAAEWSDRLLRPAAAAIGNWTLIPSSTEGYAKAEVTVGGIDTRALSSRTMEATAVPGLYAVGEAVDVTGWLGGYNFHWAWASGHAAGLGVADAVACIRNG